MKKFLTSLILCCFAFLISKQLNAQVEISADIVNRYLWRGQLLGTGPALQPSISYTKEMSNKFSFEIGAWGSYGFAANDGTEADLYASFTIGAMSIGFTDYFFPSDQLFAVNASDDKYFSYGDSTAHVYELNLSFDGLDKFPLSANFNANIGGADSDKSIYIELAYPLNDHVSLAMAMGNGWYSKEAKKEHDFAIVGVSLNVSREIEMTEKYSLPVFGALTFNPNLEKFFITFGLSF